MANKFSGHKLGTIKFWINFYQNLIDEYSQYEVGDTVEREFGFIIVSPQAVETFRRRRDVLYSRCVNGLRLPYGVKL